MSLTGNIYTAQQNLENSDPLSDDVDSINNTLTGISYDVITDTTNITNNVTISKNLILDGQNVDIRLDDIEADISNLQADVTTIEGDITNIEGDIVTIEGDVATIQSDITDIQGDITTIQGDITTIQSDITDIQGNITTIQGDITTIQGDITTIQGDITTIQSDITDIQGDITTIQSDITDLQAYDADITAIETTLTDISYASDTTTINNNVVISTGKTLTVNGTNVKASIDSINTTLTNISYSSTTTTINNNVVLGPGKTISVAGISIGGSTVIYDDPITDYYVEIPSWCRRVEITCQGAGGSAGASPDDPISGVFPFNDSVNMSGSGGGGGGLSKVSFRVTDASYYLYLTVPGAVDGPTTFVDGTNGGDCYVYYLGYQICYAEGGKKGLKVKHLLMKDHRGRLVVLVDGVTLLLVVLVLHLLERIIRILMDVRELVQQCLMTALHAIWLVLQVVALEVVCKKLEQVQVIFLVLV